MKRKPKPRRPLGPGAKLLQGILDGRVKATHEVVPVNATAEQRLIAARYDQQSYQNPLRTRPISTDQASYLI